MAEDPIELDVVAAFGGRADFGQRLAIYVPNKDRDGTPIDQKKWIDDTLRLRADVAGGATAMPPVTGAWRNPITNALIFEEPVVVYAYIIPALFVEHLEELVGFVKRLGRETNQGAVALEFDGNFFTVEDFATQT